MAASISPRREKDSRKSHRDLYKSSTPPWRETYRRRCLDKLRHSRHQLLQRLRGNSPSGSSGSLISDVMREEWAQMNRDRELFGFGDEADDFEDILSLMEDMQNELRKEEAALMVEAEIQQALEQEAVNASVENLQENGGVICPVCKRNLLLLNKGVIFCPCGLRIDTKQDCLTLSNIQQQLAEGVVIHSNNCFYQPVFSTLNMGEMTNLVMTCTKCDYMNIVI